MRRVPIIILTLLLSATVAHAQAPQWWTNYADAVLCFPFTNGAGATVTDKSANGNHGILTGGAYDWITDGTDGGIYFRGVSTNGLIVPLSNSMTNTVALTVMFWAYMGATSNNVGWAFGSRSYSIDKLDGFIAYRFHLSGDCYWDAFRRGGTSYKRLIAACAGAWVHQAVVWSGTNVTFYGNGVDAGGTYAGTGIELLGSTNVWYFGRRAPFDSEPAKSARMRAIVAYNSALPISAITNHMWLTATNWVGETPPAAAARRSIAPIYNDWLMGGQR